MFDMLNTHLLYLNCLITFAFNMTSLASRNAIAVEIIKNKSCNDKVY